MSSFGLPFVYQTYKSFRTRAKNSATDKSCYFISAFLKTKCVAVSEITIITAANTADNASVLLSFVCARLKQVSLKTLLLIKFLRILQDTKLKTTVTAIPDVTFLRAKTISRVFRIKGRSFNGAANIPAHFQYVGRCALPEQRKGTACRIKQPRQHLHQCGLACAILTDKAIDMLTFETNAHIIKSGKIAVFHGYSVCLQNNVFHLVNLHSYTLIPPMLSDI